MLSCQISSTSAHCTCLSRRLARVLLPLRGGERVRHRARRRVRRLRNPPATTRSNCQFVVRARREETLESVSSCTRFSGILKISNFGFNCSSSKLVGMFFGIVPMLVEKDFVQDCFVAQICAKMCVRAVIRAYLRDEVIRNKILKYEHWNYPKEHAYQF